ncbi:MAG: Serine/threonine-protein kinase PrkC [Planctomycetota bacterium]
MFQCALELEGDERALFVQDACGGDEELEQLVLKLLALDEDDAGSFGASAHDAYEARAAHESQVDPFATDHGDTRAFAARRMPLPQGFTPVRELGEGGSGHVELCRDDGSGDLVAVKTIDLRGLGQGGVDRVRREWRIMSSIVHPALVNLRAAGTLEERYAYLVMDFIDGLDVRAHAEIHALDARGVVALLLPVAEALALAHAHGVVHRDLKPSNILVGEDGRARLLDFGAARIAVGGAVSIHHHTLTGEMVGTLTYMSPEQAAGRARDVDGRTDVYQLAVVLYELIEGRPPYELDGLTFAETISTIVRAKPTPMQRLPEQGGAEQALVKVILKALAKRPDARQRDMETFIRALSRSLRRSPAIK